jgi:hypothetical protein
MPDTVLRSATSAQRYFVTADLSYPHPVASQAECIIRGMSLSV